MIKIGSCKIDTNIFLAPLSGCSDLAFRLISREHGARFCFFEMVDANSVTHGPKRKVDAILKTAPDDTPIAAQILGAELSAMVKTANAVLERTNVSFIDVNAACPVKKVIKKRAGAYLLKDEKNLCSIIKGLAHELPVPVTVKMRTGYEKSDPKEAARIARKCESSGAAAIFVHGRSKSQGYAGAVDYDAIRAVKDAVKIPVFGSGDIFDATLAEKMLKITGCDGISVARGAFGNPWIFGEIENHLSGKKTLMAVDLPTRKKVLKRHLAYIEKYRKCGAQGNVGIMRKVAIWYLKEFRSAAAARQKVSLVKSYEKMIELIDNL